MIFFYPVSNSSLCYGECGFVVPRYAMERGFLVPRYGLRRSYCSVEVLHVLLWNVDSSFHVIVSDGLVTRFVFLFMIGDHAIHSMRLQEIILLSLDIKTGIF